MSIIQEILYIVSNYPGGYRTIYDILYDGQPPEHKRNKQKLGNTLRVTLTRLKSKGLIKNINKRWILSKEGEEFLKSTQTAIKQFSFEQKSSHKSSKQMIVAFDIPEKKKRSREWLRRELVEAGFEQVQKSLWFGPGLPKEFVEYLGELGLLGHIKFFKVSESDLI
jgi:hypothetical protein